MPLLINHNTVTVVREGKRVKVKPTGAAYEFTDAEVTSVEDAGGRFTKPAGPATPTVVVEAAPKAVEGRPMTAAEKKAAAKAAAAAKMAEEEL